MPYKIKLIIKFKRNSRLIKNVPTIVYLLILSPVNFKGLCSLTRGLICCFYIFYKFSNEKHKLLYSDKKIEYFLKIIKAL